MTQFADLNELALNLRHELRERDNPNKTKEFVLLYAYNGTGKTRLSTQFKDIGKVVDENGETTDRDTLYFNAFTEDLYHWDNDLESDEERILMINHESKFFAAIKTMDDMDNRIAIFLNRFADFNFKIEQRVRDGKEEWLIRFYCYELTTDDDGNPRTEQIENIKVSRGEENIFIWCLFLVTVQLALDEHEDYQWVKFVYIDDPVSSLDEQNAIVLANHLIQVYRESNRTLPTVVSTHHNLLFNVLHYELKNHFRGKALQFNLSRERTDGTYSLVTQSGDTPAFHHVSALVQLHEVAQGSTIYTYHFNMLRTILEKTALFHGYTHFSKCIKRDADDSDGILHQRFIDILSHGKYSMFEPADMGEQTKGYFRKILGGFLERYPFNPDLFPEPEPEEEPADDDEPAAVEADSTAEQQAVDAEESEEVVDPNAEATQGPEDADSMGQDADMDEQPVNEASTTEETQ